MTMITARLLQSSDPVDDTCHGDTTRGGPQHDHVLLDVQAGQL